MENRDDDDPLGLRIYQKQRWLGMSETLRRLVHHHFLLECVYNECNEEYPFAGRLDVLKQYQALFGHIAVVSTMAQSPVPDCGGVLKGIYMLLSRLEKVERECDEVNQARIQLSKVLQKRFFGRYDKPKDLFTEAIMFLNPSFRTFKAMEKALRIFWKNVPDVEEKIL